MPGRSGVTVVTMLVYFFHLYARLRVHRAPGIPCALCLSGRTVLAKPRAHRAAGMRMHIWILRHCEEQSDEAIPSYFAATWIASRSLSSGAHSRDPLARNDGLKAPLRLGCLKSNPGFFTNRTHHDLFWP